MKSVLLRGFSFITLSLGGMDARARADSYLMVEHFYLYALCQTFYANLAHQLVGVKGLTKGVKVEVFNHQVRAELAVLMEYGYNIPATSQKVQERVKNAIENMTGLTVTDVNIRIAGVNMSAGKH